MKTELILHMGMPKTGTSALQVFFAKNREVLAKHGVVYPDSQFDKQAIDGKITSGNGVELAKFFNPNLPHHGDFTNYLSTLEQVIHANKGKKILFSSEFLNFNFPERFEQFNNLITTNDVRVKCVYYVRSVAGHAISSYSQFVKRGGYFRNFGYYIKNDLNYNFSNLRQSITRMGVENVIVSNYDAVMFTICENFAKDVLGLEDLQEFDIPKQTINRSLTRKELMILKRFNMRNKSPELATKLSNLMIYNEPEKKVAKEIAPVYMSSLKERYQEEIDFINSINEDIGLKARTQDIQLKPLKEIKISETENQLLNIIEQLI